MQEHNITRIHSVDYYKNRTISVNFGAYPEPYDDNPLPCGLTTRCWDAVTRTSCPHVCVLQYRVTTSTMEFNERKVFVGNLPFTISKEDLERLFDPVR
jgi:hypothetical protein